MAGYDLSFQITKPWKDTAKEFLEYSLNIARSLGLEAHYKTLTDGNFYVTFDGQLQQMQLFEEDLSRASDYFVRNKFPKLSARRVEFYGKVLRPFFTANNKGLMGITNFVFTLSKDFKGKPTGRVLSPSIFHLLDKRGLSRRSKKAVITIVDVHYRFLLGEVNEQMLIAVDGAVENILKDKLGITRGRVNFPTLLTMSLNNNLITARHQARLTLLHQHRNPVQHSGKNVNKAKLRSYISLSTDVIQKLLS